MDVCLPQVLARRGRDDSNLRSHVAPWIRMDSGNDDHDDHYFMIVIAIIILISTSRSGSTSFFVCTLHGKSATVVLVYNY